MEKIYIYTLSDPITNAVKYVGKTTNIKRRYQTYMKESRKKNKNSLVITWVKSLSKFGLKPKMEIIDEIYGEWEWLEQYWISQFKTWGFKLKNMTEGGDYNPANLPEVKDKISKALKGVVKTKEHKLNISKSKLGNPVHNSVSKKKISEATIGENNPMYGKKHSDESLSKMKLKVLQFDLSGNLIKEWDSAADVERDESNSWLARSVNRCAKGDRSTAYGFKWVYKNKKGRG